MAENTENIEITARQDSETDIENEIKTEDTPKKANSVRRRRIITGGVFSILAILGVVSIISGAVRFGASLFDDTEEREYYDSLLTSIVIYDPLPFESPEEADATVLLASSVWSTIMNEDLTQYDTDEYGATLLPAAEVDRYYAKLFGTSTKLVHGTFTDSDVEFVYNEDTQTYTIPATTYPQGYSPETVKITHHLGSKEKTVTVGYLSIQTGFNDTADRSIVKYVDYVFTKQDGEYYLTAVRDSDMKVETTSSASAAASEQ